MKNLWLSHGTSLSCVTVDDHNRCAEVPPSLSAWLHRPWSHLLAWAERQGGASWGELQGDCLTEWRGHAEPTEP